MDPSATPRHWHELPNAPAVGTAVLALAELDDGQARLVDLPAPNGPPEAVFRLILARSGTQVLAYVNRCAHFGVPLAQRQEHLIFTPHERLTCNVHYARYRWKDGSCESGECDGEGLLAVPLVCDDAGLLRIAPDRRYASGTIET